MSRPTGRRQPGRPYCEAFPTIDVHDVIRAAAAERVYLQWEDEDGLIIGFASRQELTADGFTFFWRLFGTRNVEAGAGTVHVGIRHRRAGAHWDKPSFVCPQCGRDVTRLYYVRGYWACKKSHDLLSITQRLDPVNKALYWREELDQEVRRKPITAAERRRLEKNKEKYGRAVRTLHGEVRSELPMDLQYRTYGVWLEPGALPKQKIRRNEVGYGWAPGMSG